MKNHGKPERKKDRIYSSTTHVKGATTTSGNFSLKIINREQKRKTEKIGSTIQTQQYPGNTSNMTQPRKLNKYKYCPNKEGVKIDISLLSYDKYEPWNKGNPRQKTQVCGEEKERHRRRIVRKEKPESFTKICLVQGFKKINKNYLFEEFKDYNIILHAKNKP